MAGSGSVFPVARATSCCSSDRIWDLSFDGATVVSRKGDVAPLVRPHPGSFTGPRRAILSQDDPAPGIMPRWQGLGTNRLTREILVQVRRPIKASWPPSSAAPIGAHPSPDRIPWCRPRSRPDCQWMGWNCMVDPAEDRSRRTSEDRETRIHAGQEVAT